MKSDGLMLRVQWLDQDLFSKGDSFPFENELIAAEIN